MAHPLFRLAHLIGQAGNKQMKAAASGSTISSSLQLQIRHTHVVEHFTPKTYQTRFPEKMPDATQSHKLSDPRYIYKTVRQENKMKPEPLKVLLLQTVEGIGQAGDVVSLSPFKARKNLLLPKLGVYASPENLEKYAHLKETGREDQPSSIYAKQTVEFLGGAYVTVVMSIHVPWVLTAEHVRISMRRMGIIAPAHAIQLPPKPLEGPNLDYQQKFFYVTVTVNNKERVNVRCSIHHVTADYSRKLPFTSLNHINEPPIAVFPEDQEYLTALYNQRPPLTAYSEPQLTPEMVAQGLTSTSHLDKAELLSFATPSTAAMPVV